MYSQDWNNVKQTAVVYGFSCAEHDSDWDFADQPGYGSYAFASSDSPIQLRNNSGGMDEDDAPKAEVWCPFQNENQNLELLQQQQATVAVTDFEISDDQSSGDDMDVEMDTQQDQQIQPVVAQGKRKRAAADMESSSLEAHAYYQQQQMLESAKRVRFGA